jgi:hypothetical protein
MWVLEYNHQRLSVLGQALTAAYDKVQIISINTGTM